MFARRMLYIAALTGVVTFHLFYTEFDSYLLLLALLALPALSFALSLPAMLRVRVRLIAPESVARGAAAELTVRMECAGTLPTGGMRLRLYSCLLYTSPSPRD